MFIIIVHVHRIVDKIVYALIAIIIIIMMTQKENRKKVKGINLQS